MMLALLDPEQGAVVNTGAGGKGNIVMALGAWVGGEDDPLDDEFSDNVIVLILELVIILLFTLSLTPVSWLLTCPLV